MDENVSKTSKSKTDLLEEQENVEKEKWTTNAKWIVGVLISLVISLISWIITNYIKDGNNLLEVLVNFSTILSIFLSICSIAFAGYTSIETGRQFHFMSRAVEEIRTTNHIMSENYKDLLNHYHDTVKTFSELLNRQFDSNQSNRMSGFNPKKSDDFSKFPKNDESTTSNANE